MKVDLKFVKFMQEPYRVIIFDKDNNSILAQEVVSGQLATLNAHLCTAVSYDSEKIYVDSIIDVVYYHPESYLAHRTDGPALFFSDGQDVEYYIHGRKYNDEQSYFEDLNKFDKKNYIWNKASS